MRNMAVVLRSFLRSSCLLRSSGGLLQSARRTSSSVSYPLQLATVSDQHASWYEESLRDPERFWGDLARQRLRWAKDFNTVMDCEMKEARFNWFLGGQLNVSGERTL